MEGVLGGFFIGLNLPHVKTEWMDPCRKPCPRETAGASARAGRQPIRVSAMKCVTALDPVGASRGGITGPPAVMKRLKYNGNSICHLCMNRPVQRNFVQISTRSIDVIFLFLNKRALQDGSFFKGSILQGTF